MEEFKALKAAFVAKHGDALLYADAPQQKSMCVELAPLAAFSKVPADRLLTAIAQSYANSIVPSSGERVHVEAPSIRSVP